MYLTSAIQPVAGSAAPIAADPNETLQRVPDAPAPEAPQTSPAPGTNLRDLPLDSRIAAQILAAPEGNVDQATVERLAQVFAPLSAERAQALDAASADFQAAMEAARNDPSHAGPGWVNVPRQVRGEGAGAAVTPAGPDGKAPPADKDKEGSDAAGQLVPEFSEAAFREAYLKQERPALQGLVQAYGAGSMAALLEAHPEFKWSIFSALGEANAAGTPLNGELPPPPFVPPFSVAQMAFASSPEQRAQMEALNAQAKARYDEMRATQVPTASVDTLRGIDMVISQPSNQWLLSMYIGGVPKAAELDPQKIQTFGLQRAQVMTMLERAQAAIGSAPATPSFKGEALVSDEQLAQVDALMAEVSNGYLAQLQILGINDQAGIDGYLHKGELGADAALQGVEWRFAQTDAKFGELAKLWGYADGAALLTDKPQILRWMVDPAHDRRDAPAPGNVAMAPAQVIGQIDLSLSDPQNQALIAHFGGPPPLPNGEVANDLVRQFGLTRYQAMTQLSRAVNTVRQDYMAQLNNARTDAMNPAAAASLPFLVDGKFSVEAFTTWYEAQPGAANQAFAQIMGPLAVRTVPNGDGATTLYEFGGGTWQLTGGITTYSKDLLRQEIPFGMIVPDVRDGTDWGNPAVFALDPQNPPELNTLKAVIFDPRLGWITPPKNFHHEETLGSKLLKTVVIVGISVGISIAVGGPVGAYTGSSIIGTAAGAAAGTAVTGAITGNFSWKDVLKAAVIGGLGQYFSQNIGALSKYESLKGYADLINSNAFRSTLSGGLVAGLSGESFQHGIIHGFANGIAADVGASLHEGIDSNATLSALEKAAAHGAVRMLTSAIKAAADPNNPSQAFAAALVSDFVNSLATPKDWEKVVWGNGTPEQLTDEVLQQRMKTFEDAAAAEGRTLSDSEKETISRIILQDPNMTPAKLAQGRDALLLADGAYTGQVDKTRLPPGCVALKPGEGDLTNFEADRFSTPQGLHAEVYLRPDGNVVIGLAGTEDGKDTANGNTQVVDPTAKQYEQAAKLVSDLQKVYGNRLVGFVGHSLGGGLAAMASALTRLPAITFNAAGLNASTVTHNANVNGFDNPATLAELNGLVTNYRIQDDILTGLQEHGNIGSIPIAAFAAINGAGNVPYILQGLGLLAPGAAGTQITMMPRDRAGTPVGFFERNNLFNLGQIEMHRLPQFYNALFVQPQQQR